jgi:hypothetical protein
MNNNISTWALAILAAVIVAIYLFWYMSPYQQCVRELTVRKADAPAARCLQMMNKR